ncbi:UPF0489 family protein [Sporosarcina sp. FSL K6-3457]|uniref:UPF0489 family protein n=1 Tax=Sporosarcina sp. FSL K6-3457 TaxID=2978204 RepID=UPI0030F794ED
MLITIEEHNEAYLAITYLHLKGIIKKSCLLHIDEHHDLGRVIVNKDMLHQNDIQSIKKITYEQLRVSDYILPLIYKNIIDKVFWINNNSSTKTLSFKVVEESYYNDLILTLRKEQNKQSSKNTFELTLLELNKSNIIDFNLDNWILSVDLDYFSCDDEAGEYTEIEINKKTYEEHIHNKYNKWKLHFGRKVNFERRDNQYFLTYREIDGPLENKEKGYDHISMKVEKLKGFLINFKSKPKAIIICRSLKSGYTPKESFEFTENLVRNMIYEIFKTNEEVIDINYLLNQFHKSSFSRA